MANAAITTLKQKGNALFAAGDYHAAFDVYGKAIAACDALENPQGLHLLYGNRAAAALKLQDWAGALRDSEAALAVDPRWVKALYRKAAALQGLGQLAGAAGAAHQALQLEPGNKDVQQLLQQLQQAQQPQQPQQPQQAAPAGAAPRDAARKPPPTAAAMPLLLAGAPWEYVPAADGVDENLLLLLHGLGDRPAAFARLARQMALPQTAALALGGPQEVPFSDGGRSWYTVFTQEFELIEGRPGEQRRIRSLQQAVAALQQLLGALQRRCGWQPHRVHVLGFSQGGTVGLELARQQQSLGQPLGSCIAISSSLLPEQLAQQQQAQQAQQAQQHKSGGRPGGCTPVLITRGTADKVVGQLLVEQTLEALNCTPGMQASVHSVPGKAHAMPRDQAEMRQLMQFWSQHLSRRPTAADLPPGVAEAGGAGELLEVRPGHVSVQLVQEQQ